MAHPMADKQTSIVSAGDQLLYLKKERMSHGKRVVDAFHNVKKQFYKACAFDNAHMFLIDAHPTRHRLLIERVYFEYLNLKLIG